ncbi:MAG: hypothetical protein AAF961_16005, partial [Planctomycetota bacterium]
QVAQRAILTARIKKRLADGRVDAARRLVSELNRLPGPTEFELKIDAAERQRAAKSGDPQVQRRISKLFSQTRSLLSRFLSRSQALDLQTEVESTSQDDG